MTKLLYEIIFCVVLAACSTSDIVFAQANTEKYSSKIVLDLKWGDSPKEIGYLDILRGYENAHGGPTAFDVDENGNIYILDTVHNYIKVFDQDGDLSQSFPVDDAGREYGCISLDEENNIWLHNPWNGTFRQFSSDGTLKKSIVYDKPRHIGFDFAIREGEIISEVSKIEVIGLSSKPGIKGEPVYNAVAEILGKNKPSISNAGKFSKRLYNHIGSSLTESGSLSIPRIEIIEGNGFTHELTFENMSPLISVHFKDDDMYGNVYFKVYNNRAKKPPQIWKYSPELEFVARIVLPDLPVHRGFMGVKMDKIDNEGNIYHMYLSETGIQIIKWYVK